MNKSIIISLIFVGILLTGTSASYGLFYTGDTMIGWGSKKAGIKPITIDVSNWTTSGASGVNQNGTITIGSNPHRILLAVLHYNHNVSTPNGVHIGSTQFTKIVNSNGGDQETNIWYLVNPPTGTKTVTVALASTGQCDIGLISLYNVDQTNGINTASRNDINGGGGNPSINITPTNKNAWIVGVVTDSNFVSNVQSSFYSNQVGFAFADSAEYTSNPTINQANTLSWTAGSGTWQAVAVEVLNG